MVTIQDYRLEEELYHHSPYTIQRARRESDQAPVLIKTVTPQSGEAEVARLRREYIMTASLAVEGVLGVVDLVQQEDQLALILEDSGGQFLGTLLKSKKLEIATSLGLALKLSTIMASIHSGQVIHKDIHPYNVLVDADCQRVALTGLGIASRLSSQKPQDNSHQIFPEGTLAYMSPEQTGRMNRAIDFRTDFYSFGVTLYEMLVGERPFQTSDPLELVHCHIARTAIPPRQRNEDIPQFISDMVMKLLAKTPDERYQSAHGLESDFREGIAQLSSGRVMFTEPGQQDLSTKLNIPEKLYGREGEVSTLMAAFEEVRQGAVELLLVSGYSGVGKSALVQQVHKPILQHQGYFISGKFEQLQRMTPYTAVVSAFRDLVGQLLTESEAQLEIWKGRLQAALGANAAVIIDVLPEIALIMGPQPPAPTLVGALEAQNRFSLLFQRFIRVFCQKAQPMVLFLDDLQWADSASLKFIELMMTDDESAHLLLIGAYRDNEVDSEHNLTRTLLRLDDERVSIKQIKLVPLDLEEMIQLLVDTLHRETEGVTALAELLLRKTDGNPFFIRQFLMTLQQQGLLTFEGDSGGWHWDTSRIDEVGMTDNVVELMAARVKALPSTTQAVLKLAACLGNRFDCNDLAMIQGETVGRISEYLAPAVAERLVVHTDRLNIEDSRENTPSTHKLKQGLGYGFLHDRVQQAAYELINPAERETCHLNIGRGLSENIPGEKQSDRIFELVDHLNHARNLISEAPEKLHLARLNLEAGTKAKDGTGYAAAKSYLSIGIACLPGEIWQEHFEEAFQLHRQLAETEYLHGDFEHSELLYQKLLKQKILTLQKGELYNALLVQYTLVAHYQDALTMGQTALSLFGEKLPEEKEEIDKALSSEIEAINSHIGGRSPISLLEDLPEMKNPAERMLMQTLGNLLPLCVVSAPHLLYLVTAKMVHLSLRLGYTPESAQAFAFYGKFLTAKKTDYKTGHAFGNLSLALSEQLTSSTQKCKATHAMVAWIGHWRTPLHELDAINEAGFDAGLEAGELQFCGYLCYDTALGAWHQGLALSEAQKQVTTALRFSLKTKNQSAADIIFVVQLAIRVLAGDAWDDKSSLEPELSVEAHEASCESHQGFLALAHHRVLKGCILYLLGDPEGALRAFEASEALHSYLGGSFTLAMHDVFRVLVLAAIYPQADEDTQRRYLSELTRRKAQIHLWSENCPENFAHKYQIVTAECARIQGEYWEASECYDQAILLAGCHGFIQDEALANELAGRFYLSKGRNQIAKRYLRDAHECYLRWGAEAKARDLEKRHPDFFAKEPSTGPSQVTSEVMRHEVRSWAQDGGLQNLDLEAVSKVAQAISGELVLKGLLEKFMRIILESAGAQSGALVLQRDGRWLIEADGGAGDDEAIRVLQSLPFDAGENLPAGIVNYVRRTGESLVLTTPADDNRFSSDPYVQKNKPKSILCLPVLYQAKPIGILYLENNLLSDAFQDERIQVIQILSSQAAIAIENARNYDALQSARDTLERRVQERTTALSEANVMLKVAKETAETANKAKSEFLASMSHELRTPLNAVLGYSQILVNDVTLSEKQIGAIQTIQHSGEHLLALIDDVLDVAKIEAGKLQLDASDFDLQDFLQSVAELTRFRADQKGLSFDYQPLTSLPVVVNGDVTRLRQVLINLLGNAVKFTETGGVTLSVGQIDHADGNTSLCFRIEDTGTGIAPHRLEEIFLPFHQVGERGSDVDGTGLGLAISDRLARLMGGVIEVRSTLGEGSVFELKLALPESEQGEHSRPAEAQIITGYKIDRKEDPKKILVLDDKAENRAILVSLLEPLGFDLKTAAEGRSGLEMAHRFKPDLILMDLVMPVMDGFEATRKIRASVKLKQVVVIALSASVFESQRQASLDIGCDDFVPKPVKVPELLSKIGKHLGLEWTFREAVIRRQVSTSEPQPVVAPSHDELAGLWEDARKGHIIPLRKGIEGLRQRDPQFGPFSEALKKLADEFNMKGICKLLQANMEQEK